jgi:membrane-bound ClpP family serine protease
MFGFSSSQKIEIVVIVASLILYFCGITYAQQNAWIYVFSIALLCLVVGTFVSM